MDLCCLQSGSSVDSLWKILEKYGVYYYDFYWSGELECYGELRRGLIESAAVVERRQSGREAKEESRCKTYPRLRDLSLVFLVDT